MFEHSNKTNLTLAMKTIFLQQYNSDPSNKNNFEASNKTALIPTILAKNSWATSSGSRKPLPPQQCWKILHFCELKDQKITDFQHCKWGEGEIVYSGPRLLSRIVCKKNLKNVTPTGMKNFEM